MKKPASIVLFFCLVSGLAACVPPGPGPASSGSDAAVQYQTVSALLTSTAVTKSTATPVPGTKEAPGPAAKASGTPADDVNAPSSTPSSPLPVAFVTETQPPVIPCDHALAGRPLDVTIPDDTQFHPGEYFSKTWRLVNTGRCAWTENYAAVWFSGDDLGINRIQPMSVVVEPGSSVDITVDMMAPANPGSYQSNWKMRSTQGELFGIGPNGDAPFWTRIIVVPVDTPTPTQTFEAPTLTPTPGILAQGSKTLFLNDSIDLDGEAAPQPQMVDLAFSRSAEKALLFTPSNGARLAPFGVAMPRLEDCLLAPLSEEPVVLDVYQAGTYFCYRTSGSLPGRLVLSAVDVEKAQIGLEFLTWAVP